MNTKMAEAFLMCLQAACSPNIRAVWAILTGYGYDFGSGNDYGPTRGAWRSNSQIDGRPMYENGIMCPDARAEAVRFFRDLADALEKEK